MRVGKEGLKLLLDDKSRNAQVGVIYRAVYGREAGKHREKLRKFYSQFLSPGDLVFDIGANVGVYTEVFSSLGSRVVAVEPNPIYVRYILFN